MQWKFLVGGSAFLRNEKKYEPVKDDSRRIRVTIPSLFELPFTKSTIFLSSSESMSSVAGMKDTK